MSYRCTMSRIRWLSGPAVLALALVGTACRSESEKAEGTVRDQGARTDEGSAPAEGRGPAGQGAREQAKELAREGQELGHEAREQAERVGQKAEQLAERGRELGREANDQMNRAGEQAGSLKDQGDKTLEDQGGRAREQAAPPAPREQGAQQDTGAQQQGAQQRGAQGQRGRDKGQSGDAMASQREAWTKAAQENDYQVGFNRDGSIVATKEPSKADQGKRPPDEAIRNAVSAKLADSDNERLKKLNVTVSDGVVTLRGNVADIKEATEAVNKAMEAEGVTTVISHVRPGS